MTLHIAQVPRRFVRTHWGGTETVVLETSRRLNAMGHSAQILCPNALANSDEEVIGGVCVRRFAYCYPYWGLSSDSRHQLDRKGGNLLSLPLMWELYRAPQLDLIHLHTQMRLGGSARVVARRRNIPYVVTLHGGFHDVPTEEFNSLLEPTRGAFEWGRALGYALGSRHVIADADAVLCVGEAEREATQRRYPDANVVYLPNGVDYERFAAGSGAAFRKKYNIPVQAHVILVTGRIDPQKNQAFAVQALAEITKSNPDAHLLLVGHVTNDNYYQAVQKLVCDLELVGRVTIVPGLDASSPDLTDAYHAADVFLLPSLHEPFGIVILEAWAAGLPVIASRTGGVPAFVEAGADGLLFAPGDMRELLTVYRTLTETIGLAYRLAQNGRLKARQDYSWGRVTERLASIYAEVIDRRLQRSTSVGKEQIIS